MAIANSPSKISLPQSNPGVSTVLEYLILHFPAIGREVWEKRVADGKVHWDDGSLVRRDSPFVAQQRVYYYREVEKEPIVPFAEKIIFQDELLLVAYKPHFLPVTPGGEYVEECLQSRLRRSTGIAGLQALHRIDRATAGIVLFSVDPKSRQHYHRMFETHQVRKTYQAIAGMQGEYPKAGQSWELRNRIEKSGRRFLMHIVEGVANSHSLIRCLQRTEDRALFELNPITGKTHQLRVHMQSLGWPIMHDAYYAQTPQPFVEGDFSKPLQLLAQQLSFDDPVTRQSRTFASGSELSLDD